MTTLQIIFAIIIIVTIWVLVATYMPSTPPPVNIVKWIIYILLIIILFAMLFDLIGWVDMGAVFNKRVT